MRTLGTALAALGGLVAFYGAWCLFWMVRSPDSGWAQGLEYGGSLLAIGLVATGLGLHLRGRQPSRR